jgi:hypothetical protein
MGGDPSALTPLRPTDRVTGICDDDSSKLYGKSEGGGGRQYVIIISS